jgi:hypothetical protein
MSKFAFASFMLHVLTLPSSCLRVPMFSLFSNAEVCP